MKYGAWAKKEVVRFQQDSKYTNSHKKFQNQPISAAVDAF